MATIRSKLTKILKANDIHFYRYGDGSHEIWKSNETGKKSVVASNIDSRDMANTILKQFGLPKQL